MHVLAIEPYFGGSHQAFLELLRLHSVHRWTFATLPARHWKWRMRSAPAAINHRVIESLGDERPDVILASDMLDVPTWLGLSCRDARLKTWVGEVPLVTYFHENQWSYPEAPKARVDHHYGFTNLLTAAASDACWFNSRYNRDTFFEHSESFLRRMPDRVEGIDLARIRENSRVIPPGFVPPVSAHASARTIRPTEERKRPTLGWVARFDHDKRPDRFSELVERLADSGLEFDLILLGGQGQPPDPLAKTLVRLQDRVRFCGFAGSRTEYEDWLSKIDLVVSTADHEFFGIAICEAIWAGAVPIVPDDLSYREYVPDSLRYQTIEDAAERIRTLAAGTPLSPLAARCRESIADFRPERVTERIDAELQRCRATQNRVDQ